MSGHMLSKTIISRCRTPDAVLDGPPPADSVRREPVSPAAVADRQASTTSQGSNHTFSVKGVAFVRVAASGRP